MTSPLPRRRTFLALDLTMVCPIETWPSPPITTLPPLRTVRMVVPCQEGSSFDDMRSKAPRSGSSRHAPARLQTIRDGCGETDKPLIKGAPAKDVQAMRNGAVKRKTKETDV